MAEDIPDIQEKISQRIRKSEQGKEFKDTDVVGYTRKYSAAYDIITSADLSAIETDNVTAYKLIEKSKIWPIYNIPQLQEQGNSSGAAYLKVKTREALGNRPIDSKDARGTYVNAIALLQNQLTTVKTVAETLGVIKAFCDLDKFDFGIIPPTIKPAAYSYGSYTGNFKNYSRRDIEKYFDDIFGRRFSGFCKGQTESGKKTQIEAHLYEGFSSKMEDAAVKQRESGAQKRIEHYQQAIEKVKSGPDTPEALNPVLQDMNLYFSGPKIKADIIRMFEASIQKLKSSLDAARENLPKYFRARQDDWSWSGEKKKTTTTPVDELDKVAKAPLSILEKYGIKDWKKSSHRIPLDFIKRTGGISVQDISTTQVTEQFGFRNVIFGNYVNNKERKESLRHFLGSMLDLYEIINLDVKGINQLGGLDINFGSTGCGTFSMAMACYFARLKAINITKKAGDGCIAHEWSHYLDNVLGDGAARSATKNPYASNLTDFYKDSVKIKTLFQEFKIWLKTAGGSRKVIAEFAAQRKYKYRLFGDTVESAVAAVQAKYPQYALYESAFSNDTLAYYGYIAHKLNDNKPIEVALTTTTSIYYFNSSRFDSTGDYWTYTPELFARALEWFVEDSLKKQDRTSNYLVDTSKSLGDLYFLIPYNDHPYPRVESEQIWLRDWFDRLFSAIRTEFNIQPFRWDTTERSDEYSEYAPGPNAKIETGTILTSGNSIASGNITEFEKGYSFQRVTIEGKSVYKAIFAGKNENLLISKLTKVGWDIYSKTDDGQNVLLHPQPFKSAKEAQDFIVKNSIKANTASPIPPTEPIVTAEPEPPIISEPMFGTAYHGLGTQDSPGSKYFYLADKEMASAYGEDSDIVETYEYSVQHACVVRKDSDFYKINELINEYLKQHPGVPWHPDTTSFVNQTLEKEGYDALIIEPEALQSEYGYREIDGTYGGAQIIIFDKKDVKLMETENIDTNSNISVAAGQSKNYNVTPALTHEFNSIISEIDTALFKQVKSEILKTTTELGSFVSEHPQFYPKFFEKMLDIPKKYRFSLNPYDKDTGMPSVVKWLSDTNKNLFEIVPLKEYELPKYKAFDTVHEDKVFMKIHADFVGTDDLRPVMMGINFNEYGAVSTNAHILLFTPYRSKSHKPYGNFCFTRKCFEQESSVESGKYPAWQQVIPKDNPYKISLDVKALYNFLKNAINLQVAPEITHMVAFNYPEKNESDEFEQIGFNIEFLLIGITALLELGHTEIEISFSRPNRAALLYPKLQYGKVSDFKVDFALVMPVLLHADMQASRIHDFIRETISYDFVSNCAAFLDNPKLFCFTSKLLKQESKNISQKQKVVVKKKPAATVANILPSKPSLSEYQESLAGAEIALEFEEDAHKKQDLQDYIEGLKLIIEIL